MNDLIRQLTEAVAPSGFEAAVRDIIQPLVAPLVDSTRVDALGNLIAHRAGDGNGRKVMLAAHMDEIGVMVNHVGEDGFLRFTPIGGVFPQTLQGGRVVFTNGVVGVIHREYSTRRNILQPLDKHFIDVGATSRETSPVGVGAAAAFQRDFVAQGTRLTAKAMDDRIGCAILIQALEQLAETPHDIYAVFSVQEEVGTRGAEAAANHILPDVGIAIDVTSTGDTPHARHMAVELGGGPAIKVKDARMLSHPGLVRLMRERAEGAGLPYQMEVLEGGSTDARSMQVAGAGSVAGCLSIPCRYLHTQSETLDAQDVTNTSTLLATILSQPLDL